MAADRNGEDPCPKQIDRNSPSYSRESLFVAPTPMMEPAMVWVVLTGMPSFSLINNVMAPAVLR
jgi:hypothetical protein